MSSLYDKIRERANGRCENCGKRAPLEIHHIIFRGKVKETEDNCIALCAQCHRGTDGVHGKNGKYLNLKLKLSLQEKYFVRGLKESEVRKLMGGMLYSSEEYFR